MCPCERVRRRCGGGYYAGMGRPRPGALGYRESSFGWEGCCSCVWCRAARTSSLAAGRWHSATGVEACEEQDGSAAGRLGAHRGRPPRRLGVRSWTATEAPVDVEDRGAPMAQPLRGRSAGLPPHVDPPPLLAVSLSTRPCSSCLTGRVLPRAPLPGGLPFLA